MLAYKYLMQIYEVSHYRICATSAMRDASNAAKVVDEVEEETGLRIEVISGEEEARLVGHSRVRQLVRDEETYYVMVDVGGGSTEVSILRGSHKVDSRSFNIGTVRLLSGLVRKSELEEYHTFLDSIHERCGDLEIFGTGEISIVSLRSMAPRPRGARRSRPLSSTRSTTYSREWISTSGCRSMG